MLGPTPAATHTSPAAREAGCRTATRNNPRGMGNNRSGTGSNTTPVDSSAATLAASRTRSPRPFPERIRTRPKLPGLRSLTVCVGSRVRTRRLGARASDKGGSLRIALRPIRSRSDGIFSQYNLKGPGPLDSFGPIRPLSRVAFAGCRFYRYCRRIREGPDIAVGSVIADPPWPGPSFSGLAIDRGGCVCRTCCQRRHGGVARARDRGHPRMGRQPLAGPGAVLADNQLGGRQDA